MPTPPRPNPTLVTPATLKREVCEALLTCPSLAAAVTSASQMQGFLDAIKAWTLPAAGVIYEGRTRAHPNEAAKQKTSSVDMHFGVLLAVPTLNSMGYAVEDPVDELEEVRRAISAIKFSNGRPCIFVSERIMNANSKVTVWVQKWQIATNVL